MYISISELYKRYLLVGGLVSTDSRSAQGLFFALCGEKFDAHDFVEQALNNGAKYVVVERINSNIDSDKQLLVEDVQVALSRLATHHRQMLKIPIIALTGTNGKTTTKELLKAVLSTKFTVAATKGNLNNHLGVPLTLLTLTEEQQLAIVEMGANHPGEIDFLCQIAQPDFGLITNVGKAHLEGFGSFEGVKKTKAELYHYFDVDHGTIFYNDKDKDLCEMADPCPCKKIAYQFKLENIRASEQGTLMFDYNNETFNTKLSGLYNVNNVEAAFAVGSYFGVDPIAALKAVEMYTPANNRSQIINTQINTVYMDAYNANPSSMEASIKNFVAQKLLNKVYILGDMLELGAYSKDEHQNIITLLQQSNVEKVFLIGKEFSAVNSPYKTFENVKQLTQHLTSEPIVHSNILIKGSRGIALETVLPIL